MMPGSNAVYKALSDPTRRKIVQLLGRRPHTSGDLAEQFPTSWATISRHLAVLREAGVVTSERNGNSIRYELNTTVVQELIAHIFDWTGRGGQDA